MQPNLTFYDNYIPTLPDGEYAVTISQSVTVDETQTKKDGGNADVEVPSPLTQKFIVRGPRFTLPPTDINRVFPVANSIGAFDTYLPMIVFNEPSLPWEHLLNLSAGQCGKSPQGSFPWIALLVFTEDQLLPPQPASGVNAPAPDGSQANPGMSASFPLNNIVQSSFNGKPTDGPPTGILGPTLILDDDEDPNNTSCYAIDMTVETFTDLVPSLDDLRFLSHVRMATTEDKATAALNGWFSTVINNRSSVPPPGGGTTPRKNIVHLVSLEGWEPYLRSGATASADTASPPLSNYQKVRMISLYSWTFSCLSDPKENFRELMQHLIGKQSEAGTDLLLRMPLPKNSLPAQGVIPQLVADRLLDGYIPLSYITRTGESTFAWYRGPLTPVVTTTFLDLNDPGNASDPSGPLNTSEALVYDKTAGLFDTSYAVAFQTGRSLALANQSFATGLFQWRRKVHGLVDALQERLRSPLGKEILQKLNNTNAGEQTAAHTKELFALLEPGAISNAFKKFLSSPFFSRLVTTIGKTPQPDPLAINTNNRNSAPAPKPSPASLKQLMQNPAVIDLIHHLSGLGSAAAATAGIGSTANAGIGDSDPILPPKVTEWLAKRALLYDIPFNNLVAGSLMLPQETIRFFYIDQNWIDALLDGALSAGIQSSRDALLHAVTRKKLFTAVKKTSAGIRDRLRGTVSDITTPATGKAGFLLRSAVVSGWPGLEVRGWSANDATNPMKPLRIDRVAPDMLIVIYPDIPVKIKISEPSEGLVFGFEDNGIELRYLPGMSGETAAMTGFPITPGSPVWLSRSEIDQTRQSQPADHPPLKIAGTGGLVEALQNKFPAPGLVLTPASFAVEMVCVPEQMLFLQTDILDINPSNEQ